MKNIELNFQKTVLKKFIKFAIRTNNVKGGILKVDYTIGEPNPAVSEKEQVYPVQIKVKTSQEAFKIGSAWTYFCNNGMKLNQWDEFVADQKIVELKIDN